jgi:hypothetical protein
MRETSIAKALLAPGHIEQCDDLSLILTYTSIGSYEREGTLQAIGTYERRGAFTLAGTYGHTFPTVLAKNFAGGRNYGSSLILTALTMLRFLHAIPGPSS